MHEMQGREMDFKTTKRKLCINLFPFLSLLSSQPTQQFYLRPELVAAQKVGFVCLFVTISIALGSLRIKLKEILEVCFVLELDFSPLDKRGSFYTSNFRELRIHQIHGSFK